MTRVAMGRTGLRVEQNGFGALPIQRIPKQEAVYLLGKAYDGGMDFFDTARGYTDSEEKLGEAFGGMRDKVVIATKSMAGNAKDFWGHLETSLRMLKTDYIDIHQFHNPPFCPGPGDPSGLYDAMLQAREQGKVRFIGITNHRLDVAREAVESGLYETLQFPFGYLATGDEVDLVRTCGEKGVGFIAMKALSGGLITDAGAACAWITRFGNVVPVWGIQRERELDEILSHIKNPPKLDEGVLARIEADKAELGADFCRGCGYCMPCPQGITIHMAARASLLLRRAPVSMIMSENGQAMMGRVAECTECGQCSSKCPYGLDTPALLKRNYGDFLEVRAGKPLGGE